MPEVIPVFRPAIGPEELAAASESLSAGWLGMGADVGRFEEGLQALLGANDRFVTATSTGHAALHLAMILAGVGDGDEVITPAFNNIADFQAILAVGAKPVFCDIRDDTLCIDVDDASALVTKKTRAIIAMDYACALADHQQINDLASAHGLRVIHDAAHSLGSRLNGKPVGSFSDICMFSFDPVKTITCIDGGALVTRSSAERDMLHELRLIGMTQPAAVMYENQRAWTYDVNRLGFRYHMPNLHAAIGVAQLRKFDEISRSRQRTCRLYNDLLSPLTSVRTPEIDFDGITPFLYYIRVADAHRDPLRKALKKKGADSGIHWQPGHHFSLFKDLCTRALPVTDRVAGEIISLPLHSFMHDDDVRLICKAIGDYFCHEQ